MIWRARNLTCILVALFQQRKEIFCHDSSLPSFLQRDGRSTEERLLGKYLEIKSLHVSSFSLNQLQVVCGWDQKPRIWLDWPPQICQFFSKRIWMARGFSWEREDTPGIDWCLRCKSHLPLSVGNESCHQADHLTLSHIFLCSLVLFVAGIHQLIQSSKAGMTGKRIASFWSEYVTGKRRQNHNNKEKQEPCGNRSCQVTWSLSNSWQLFLAQSLIFDWPIEMEAIRKRVLERRPTVVKI